MTDDALYHLYVWYPSTAFKGYVVLSGRSLKEALNAHDLPAAVDTYITTHRPDETLLCPSGVIIASTATPGHRRDVDHL